MNKYRNVNDKWIKASIIGTIWAASEIVLGSFLHNLKIPFSGNILTAIGIIILVSASYVWSDRGLFWRAGLICAVMKTLSPSAVVFGPMIAIFTESLLIELSALLLGRNIAGYILGAMLAMSWNLFQKIINYIIFYGTDIVKLYKDFALYVQKQFEIQFDLVWTPVIFLLFIYCIFGVVAALIAIKVGRTIIKQPVYNESVDRNPSKASTRKDTSPEFKYSLIWLAINLFLIAANLFVLQYSWYIWVPATIVSATIWVSRYRRSMRLLLKFKFWLFFLIITMAVAYIVTKIRSGSLEQGLLEGLEMNFRAIIIILGFSAMGSELYNPVIGRFFSKTMFRQLPLALELSFASLPLMLAEMPDVKTIIKNPVTVFVHIISQINNRLKEIKRNKKKKLIIVTGQVGSGKTTCIVKLIELFKANTIEINGIYSQRIMEDNNTIGYDVVDIRTNNRYPFLRVSNNADDFRIGKYRIIQEGLKSGIKSLEIPENITNAIIIIDEVGLLELENKGWAESLEEILNNSDITVIMTIRDIFVDRVIQKWGIEGHTIFNISESNPGGIFNFIIKPE